MVDPQQVITQQLNELSPEESNDERIKDLFRPFTTQGIGIKNMLLRLSTKYFKNYAKRELGTLLKECKNGHVKDEEEDDIKPYILIADDVLQKYKIITLEESYRMLVFDNYSYTPKISKLKRYISNQVKFHNMPHRSTVGDVLDYLTHQTSFSVEQLNYDDKIMIFPNGVYNFRKNGFGKYKHPEDKYFFYELGVDYEKGFHDCPKFKRALVQWIDEKTDVWYRKGQRKILINDIFEAIGLCMTMKMDLKSAFLNYGPPNCGKTQFFNIICHIIGKNNISNTSLQRLGKNEFGGEGLQFKILNYCGDLPSSKIMDTGLFKSITGGDTMVESEKKGGDKHQLFLTCKFWFNANKVPRIGRWDDDASYDRFIMIPFPNTFKRLESAVESFWKIITEDEEEIQGIIHEAIKGFKRLLKRGNFRNELREDTIHTWKYHSDKVYAFVHDYCEKTNDKILVTEVYEVFSNVFMGESMNVLTKGLARLGVRRKQGWQGKKHADYYVGIKWKDDFKASMEGFNVVDAELIQEARTILDEF